LPVCLCVYVCVSVCESKQNALNSPRLCQKMYTQIHL